MPSCVFRRCKNYTATVRDRKISFHLLPRKGLIREKWLKIVRTERREDDWMPNTYSTVCSEHFLKQDFYSTKKNILRLKKTAVPVLKSSAEDLHSSLRLTIRNKEDIITTLNINIKTNKKGFAYLNNLLRQDRKSNNFDLNNFKLYCQTVIHNFL
ncbi:hypothetical protein K1T71_012328 [Dendrolimus kikuchii]|uniref:Uncharacterized protein n=1 Tax=Dendrolimus kikuchii TaxID=765133 RepID=A0ACC1CL88_9NEOP|nr:hypothetical protein K1T71_012328 [Dendrolimus kikuchii]